MHGIRTRKERKDFGENCHSGQFQTTEKKRRKNNYRKNRPIRTTEYNSFYLAYIWAICTAVQNRIKSSLQRCPMHMHCIVATAINFGSKQSQDRRWIWSLTWNKCLVGADRMKAQQTHVPGRATSDIIDRESTHEDAACMEDNCHSWSPNQRRFD